MITANRNDLAQEIREHFHVNYPSDLPGPASLYWAQAVVEVMAEHDVRAIIQAGTCGWPRVAPPGDKHGTHFTYKWEPLSEATKDRIAKGLAPEIHVWAAIPETAELIDMTTGFMVEDCKKALEVDWPGPKPPSFFWGTAHEVPKGAFYRVCLYAMAWALRALQNSPILVPNRVAPFSMD